MPKRAEADRTHSTPSKPESIRISGTVAHRAEFRKPINPSLDFVLAPNEGGWTISVVPHAGDCTEDFVEVATGPFRAYNPRYVFASYDFTTEDAMEYSPRPFRFVLSCSDYKFASDNLNCVLWPCADRTQEEAAAKIDVQPRGQGQLWITDYKITRPKRHVNEDVGYAEWMKFEVELVLPPIPK